MRFLEEMRKNALTLVRSPAALVTLVIGPLVLLVLVGLTLSGNTLHDVVLGVTGPGAASVQLNGTVQVYNNTDDCVVALRNQSIIACLEFQRFDSASGFPQGTVIVHIDESRDRVTQLVVDSVSAQLGLESSRLRVQGVQGLLDQFGKIAAFMTEKRNDLISLRQEALSLRSDVNARKVQAETRQQAYRAVYYPVRERLLNTSISLGDAIDSLDPLILTLQETIATINDTNISAPLQNKIIELSLVANQSRLQVKESTFLAGTLLNSLQSIDEQFDGEVNSSREYVQKIDAGVNTIDISVLQLDADIQQLSLLDPSIAARIDKPIVEQVTTLFQNLRPIVAGFAQLFCIVVMFISTLFGAIVTLMEINSRAVLRNTLAPTSEAWTIVALWVTSVIVVAIQAAVLLLVAEFMLDVDVVSALSPTIIIGLLLTSVFVCLGIAIALRLRKEQATVLVATFVALIVLLFSDVLTPIQLMPSSVGIVVQYNPLVIAASALKQCQLFGAPLSTAAIQPLLIAVLVAALLLIVAYGIYRKRSARW